MSGTIHIVNNKSVNKYTNTSFYNSQFLPKKHNHVELVFESFKIIYNDPRRFGFFQLIKNNSDLIKRFNNLGPEPFDKNFNLDYVYNFFKGKNKDIKNFLLDQKFVSGIGNIYASEILFLSKVNPSKKAKLLSKKECQKIIISSRKILLKAISKGGSSVRDFKDTSGLKGGFQKEFKVYQQEGEKCKNLGCFDLIKKKIIGNRSTFFCDSCQK
jgi:formamidopyrimidine-DNA glycosylase